MARASRFLAYGIGLLAAFFLALATFSIAIQFTNVYDAVMISIIPFVVFSGAWILTLRLVFKI